MKEYKVAAVERQNSVVIHGYQEEQGVMHGVCVYKENGLLHSAGFYQYGSSSGVWTYYDKNGDITSQTLWIRGYIKGSVLYKDGKPDVVTIKNVSLNGRRSISTEQTYAADTPEAAKFLEKVRQLEEAQRPERDVLLKIVAQEELKYVGRYPIAVQPRLPQPNHQKGPH